MFEDQASGLRTDRPGLAAALDYLRDDSGDVLVVWRLDRLGRSTRQTLEVLDDLQRRGIGFLSVTEGLDTTGPMGRAMITIIAAFATLERDVLVERTRAGLAASRARGRVGGRPRALTEAQVRQIRALKAAGEPVTALAATFGVGTSSIYRALEIPVEAPVEAATGA